MAGEAKAEAGRPARTRAAESRVTDDASRGQPERRPEAEPVPLPVTEPVMVKQVKLLPQGKHISQLTIYISIKLGAIIWV